jgi:hypothetical protein
MRQDAGDQFVVVINFSNRPVTGRVEVRNSEQFKPVQISGMSQVPGGDFPLCHLGAFGWRIYHRTMQP